MPNPMMANAAVSPTARRAAALATLLLLAACSSVHRNPVPIEVIDQAQIPGMPGVRDWGDEPSPHFQEDLTLSLEQERTSNPGLPPLVTALLLSGGGSNGAFGAGYLNGWTERGTRPVFKIVTGISTGALLAPFAFLGSDYDPDLESLYTTTTRKGVFKLRNPLTVLRKDSLARTEPLSETLNVIIDQPLLDAIADEHRAGRRLYVGTTNLDAQRLVIWNMGAIAASGAPGAVELFRQVLLASASIPVAFPPVYINVAAEGRYYDEMHVDGGVIAEFFLWGAMVDITSAVEQLDLGPGDDRRGEIYIIRNSQIEPAPAQVEPRLAPIAERSMLTLLKAIGMGDLIRIWALARRHDVGFNYVGIPPDQDETNAAAFDPAEMRRLYDLGFSMALADEPWRTEPPSFID